MRRELPLRAEQTCSSVVLYPVDRCGVASAMATLQLVV